MVTKKRSSYGVEAKAFIDNPSHKDLRQFTSQMENAHTTVFGNYDVFTRVDARSTASTYIVTDTPERHDSLTIRQRSSGFVRSRIRQNAAEAAPLVAAFARMRLSQTRITKEMLEIASGAEALSKG